ncbi:MAG TPA: PIN domain-containing protein [Candidatus Dormibacteraeota bacterium]|nr:PIN domain-containing protein [Candidatus Dormibacteraeota bacterium]
MGARPAPDRGGVLTVYVLDSTVLIGYLRDLPAIASDLRGRLAEGHTLATTCVNIAEVERGLRAKERQRAAAFLDALRFLPTNREAASRAGRHQADFARRGRTIHTADALVAGTARAHGAVLLTHNVSDFPMHDLRVELPEATAG